MSKGTNDKEASGRIPRSLTGSPSAEQAVSHALRLCEGMESSDNPVADLKAASPQVVPEGRSEQVEAYLTRILRPNCDYNIVWTENGRMNFPGEFFRWYGPPSRDALDHLTTLQGLMIRPNAIHDAEGRVGSVFDRDVLHHDHLLIESDALPIALQAQVILRLIQIGLQIQTAVHTGGKSIHALVRVDAGNVETFRKEKDRIFLSLRRYGFDMSVGNPSRLTRMPGAPRTLKDNTPSLQKLLYIA